MKGFVKFAPGWNDIHENHWNVIELVGNGNEGSRPENCKPQFTKNFDKRKILERPIWLWSSFYWHLCTKKFVQNFLFFKVTITRFKLSWFVKFTLVWFGEFFSKVFIIFESTIHQKFWQAENFKEVYLTF